MHSEKIDNDFGNKKKRRSRGVWIVGGIKANAADKNAIRSSSHTLFLPIDWPFAPGPLTLEQFMLHVNFLKVSLESDPSIQLLIASQCRSINCTFEVTCNDRCNLTRWPLC